MKTTNKLFINTWFMLYVELLILLLFWKSKHPFDIDLNRKLFPAAEAMRFNKEIPYDLKQTTI